MNALNNQIACQTLAEYGTQQAIMMLFLCWAIFATVAAIYFGQKR